MTGPIAPTVEALVAAGEPVVLVTVEEAQGSTPRPAGTGMAVTSAEIHGTIGGGRLEWEAVGKARGMIADGETSARLDMPLGPAVGQCCGGRVALRLTRADEAGVAAMAAVEERARRDSPQVAVFGAGHVGKALVRALTPLPLRLLWADSRQDQFPPGAEDKVEVVHSDPVEIVGRMEPGAALLVMTFSHALDYAITAAALRRDDLAYVGLIGSKTKRRRFERWFLARGGDTSALEGLVSPIGDFGVPDKRPEVIAALVTAEILRALAEHGSSLGEQEAERQGAEAVP